MRNVRSMWERALSSPMNGEGVLRPLYSVNFNKDEDILRWTSETLRTMRELRRERVKQWDNNINYYKGVIDSHPDNVILDRGRLYQPRQRSRVTVNEGYEIVEQKVAHIMRYKPNVIPVPANNEYNDRDAARMAEYVIDYLQDELKVEKTWEAFHRYKYVLGEGYLYVHFDPYKGQVHPDYKRLKEEQGTVRIENSLGETIELDMAIRVGEISTKILLPHFVYVEPCTYYEDAKWCILEEIVDIEELRALHGPIEMGSKTAQYREPRDISLEYDGGYGYSQLPENKVRCYHIFHEDCAYLDEGRYLKIIDGQVLSNTPHPYNHKKLPIIRLTDIDIPGDTEAMSTLENIWNLNKVYNIVLTNMAKAVALVANPKIFTKKGSVNKADFTNGINIIEYKTDKPSVEAPNVISANMFALKDELRKDIERHSGVHGISRGAPPPGIRAGIALQFLEEQENQRANAEIIKNNIAIREFWTQVMSLVGQFYRPDDERTLKVVGKDGEFTVKSLKNADLSGPFDIRIQNTSALPDSKAGRTQAILDYREILGEEVVPNEQVADMLGLAQPEKFISYVSAAVRMAESENESMLKGEGAKAEVYHEHISHWRTHFKAMQTRAYQENTTEKIREAFETHLMAHEMRIVEIMSSGAASPMFMEQVSQLEHFPVFFTPETPPAPSAGETPPMGGGAAPPLPPELMGDLQDSGVPPGAPVSAGEMAVPPQMPPGAPVGP